jgi:hypothetical protein
VTTCVLRRVPFNFRVSGMTSVDFHEHQRSSRPAAVFESLLRLKPRLRVASGMIGIAGGVIVSVLLWNRGVVWGYPLFAAGGGTLLLFSGLAGLRKEKARRELLTSVEEQKGVMIDAMVAEKRDGRNPIRWLNDQGIHDAEIRSLLIEGMNERLQRPTGK